MRAASVFGFIESSDVLLFEIKQLLWCRHPARIMLIRIRARQSAKNGGRKELNKTEATNVETIAARLPIKRDRFRSSKKETALFRSHYGKGEQFICFILQRDSYKIAVKGCLSTIYEPFENIFFTYKISLKPYHNQNSLSTHIRIHINVFQRSLD